MREGNIITRSTCSCIGNVALLDCRSAQAGPRGFVADADSLQGNTRLPFSSLLAIIRHQLLVDYQISNAYKERTAVSAALVSVPFKIVLVID